MIIVNVYFNVREEMIDAFMEATIKNARNSINEPGILRFEILQQEDDPSRFLAMEIFKSEKARLEHKKTAHYEEWLKVAVPMLAEPRVKTIYRNLFPDENKW
ncbi:MAG: putative quinol monooxygenase [Candidatus Humimicrobiaceae bacterium]